uniref:Elicitin n=1 Tax=Achlya hypogyna TaxID=1202772 RepID=A0A0A7CND2_ACHHY|nr:secreted protein [Achlya hypogyna]
MKFLVLAAVAAIAVAHEGHDHSDHVDCNKEQSSTVGTFLSSAPPADCNSVWATRPGIGQVSDYFTKNPEALKKLCANNNCKSYFTKMAALPDCMYEYNGAEFNVKDDAEKVVGGCEAPAGNGTGNATIATPTTTAAATTVAPAKASAGSVAALSALGCVVGAVSVLL